MGAYFRSFKIIVILFLATKLFQIEEKKIAKKKTFEKGFKEHLFLVNETYI